MKESKFIEQNKKSWLEFESNLRHKQNKATRLSNLFIQVTDDLSYVRTFYKHRSVKIYLNGIAQILFNDLYRNRSAKFSNFIRFWKYELPMHIHDARKEFRLSFLIFFLALGVGILSSVFDKDFARFIMGDEYVRMTTENIRHHDPMAIYKSAGEADMFLVIVINNLLVALRTFGLGILFCVGTVFQLIYNGINLGSFQYFFIQKGLFLESFITVLQHGTLEISSIIIAGAAGITLGKGIVFPGTFARMESFKLSAVRGLKIFLGIVPVIVLAAFIEGFMTRHTDFILVVRILIIGLSLSFILGYFVWYPWYLSKKRVYVPVSAEKPGYKEPWKYDFSRVLSAEEIMGYTIKFFNQKFLFFITVLAGISAFHAVAATLNDLIPAKGKINTNAVFEFNHSFFGFFQTQHIFIHLYLGILSLCFLQAIIGLQLKKSIHKSQDDRYTASFVLKLTCSVIISSVLILVPFFWGFFWGTGFLFLLSPFLFLAFYHSLERNSWIIPVIPETVKLLNASWKKLFWNSLKIFAFLLTVFILVNTPLVSTYLESLFINFKTGTSGSNRIWLFVFTFITMGLFSFYFTLQMITSAFSYYAFQETAFARNLKERIHMLGEHNKMFGFEKEKE